MIGIKSYGAHVPILRLNRDVISKIWGSHSTGGERSVANWDEDSLTMAVGAALDCINGIDRKTIDGLFFASTTSPYKEKQGSTLIAAAVDLGEEIFTADFGNSLRAGTTSLRAAFNAVKSGSAKNILVTASDCRLGTPKSAEEQTFGDGAAAFLLGDSEVVATIEGMYSVSDEITDVWRRDEDIFVKTWEDRWRLMYGYTKNMQAAINGVMKKYGLAPKDFAKVILYGPDTRSIVDLSRSLGFDPKNQLQDSLLTAVGNTGAAHSLMMLVSALEEAKAGDQLLLASYGGGSDAFILQATEELEKIRGRRGIKGRLSSKMSLPNYERYLVYRGLLTLPEEFIRLFPSATVMWRTQDWALRFHGSKCKRCGITTFPIQRVCCACQAKDEFEKVRLSDKKGKVFTFSLDNLAGGADPPVVQTIVELDGCARIYCMMTDCDPKEIRIGMPVEMTFRKFHEHGGFHNYFWKCRPIR